MALVDDPTPATRMVMTPDILQTWRPREHEVVYHYLYERERRAPNSMRVRVPPLRCFWRTVTLRTYSTAMRFRTLIFIRWHVGMLPSCG